jgi:hypothetical protein
MVYWFFLFDYRLLFHNKQQRLLADTTRRASEEVSTTHRCHKTVLRNSLPTFRTVHVSDFILKVWFVFMVLTLESSDLFWWFSWTLLVVPLYLSLWMYHLPKWHMMSVQVWPLSTFVFIIVLDSHLLPSDFAFFIRTQIIMVNNLTK